MIALLVIYILVKRGYSISISFADGKVNLEGIAEQLEISVKESFINIVSVNVAEYAKEHFEKSVKKTLTIPAWLNKAALDKGINFSQVLQEALKEKVLSSNTNTSKV